MTGLSSRLLAAFLAQTLGLPMKAIRGRGKVTVMAAFGQPGLQVTNAFTQHLHLVSQGAILLSQLFQLFVFVHVCTLLACSLLCYMLPGKYCGETICLVRPVIRL